LLHHVRQLMGHQGDVVGALVRPQPDMILMSEGFCFESLRRRVRRCVCVDLNVTQVNAEHRLNAITNCIRQR
jgi:hypothetical protein